VTSVLEQHRKIQLAFKNKGACIILLFQQISIALKNSHKIFDHIAKVQHINYIAAKRTVPKGQ